MNQYIVFALTRQATLAYTVQAVSEEEVKRQRAAFSASLGSLGKGRYEEIEKTLREREAAEPENGLSPEVMKRLQERIVQQKAQRIG